MPRSVAGAGCAAAGPAGISAEAAAVAIAATNIAAGRQPAVAVRLAARMAHLHSRRDPTQP
ncbi:MAG: hypothetical protein R2749_15335 [Acidimicrobiales bacterium]